jgi:hypothetical protein
MGTLVWRISKLTLWTESQFAIEKIGVMAGALVAAVLVYILLAKLLKVKEADFLLNMIRNRF